MSQQVCCLVKVKSPKGIRSHLIFKDRFSIGRAADADVSASSPSVSRTHILVQVTANEISIFDQGSANGTFVNGEKLSKQAIQVNPTDEVLLGSGDEVFIFERIENLVEAMNLDQSRDLLKAQMADLQKHFKDQAALSTQAQIKDLHDQAMNQAAQIQEQAKREAKLILDKTKQQEISILQSAEDRAQKSLFQAKAESTKIKEQATEQAYKKRAEIEAENSQLETEWRTQFNQQKIEAQKQLQEQLNEAHNQAQMVLQKARENQEAIAKQTQQKNIELLQSAERKAEEVLQSARQEAHQLKIQNQQEIQKLYKIAEDEIEIKRQDVQKESQDLLSSVRARVESSIAQQTEQHLKNMNLEREASLHETQLQCKKMLDQAQSEAKKEQEKIIRDYKAQISELETQTQQQKLSFEDLQNSQSEVRAQAQKLQSQVDFLRSDIENKEKLILDLEDQRLKAVELIKLSESAESKTKEAQAQYLQTQKELEKTKAEIADEKRRAINEIQPLREKTLLEHEELKKSLSEEIARNRLKALEELKQSLAQEEQKFNELKSKHAKEIAHRLELRVIPKIREVVGDQANSAKLLEIRDEMNLEISESLKSLNESLKIQTQNADPQLDQKNEARKKRIKKISIAATAAALVLIFIFKDNLMEVIRKADKNNFASQMIEERKIKSQYKPEQTDVFHANYTDNVIFLKNYSDIKSSQEYINTWSLELNNLEYLRSMGLSEEDAIMYISKEANLVSGLMELRKSIDAVYLEQGIQRMRNFETERMEEILKTLKSEANFKNIQAKEKAFFEAYKQKNHLKMPASIN